MNLIYSSSAKQDVINIVYYTIDTWGERQATIYKNYLKAGEQTIKENPYTPLSQSREELQAKLRSLKVEKHLIFYRLRNKKTIEIIRILHESMDFKQHI